MKHFMTATVVLLCWLCAQNMRAASPEIETAKKDGAKGKITFRITDSKGNLVENAKVSAGFYNPRKRNDSSTGMTDTNGLCTVEGVSDSQMRYTIIKEGHYKTEAAYWFYPGAGRSVLDGHWQPWNPINTVVLKEHRNPVPMYAENVDILIPVQGSPIGFDLEKGDWVAPHGQGSRSDLLVRYVATYEGPQAFSKRIEMSFSSAQDGVQVFVIDGNSKFISMYAAPEEGYVPTLVLERERTRDKIIKSQEIGEGQYLVFRVRTVKDKDGKLISANYGKIYGPIDYGRMGEKHRLMFSYFFNPTANDRNLEFDPSRNLFQWKHDAHERPCMP